MDHVLPIEVWLKIFANLSDSDQLACSAVCSSWRSCIDFYKRQFPDLQVSRLKIYRGGVKVYTETDFLREVVFDDVNASEIIPFSLLEPVMKDLTQLQLINSYEFDVSTGFGYLRECFG